MGMFKTSNNIFTTKIKLQKIFSLNINKEDALSMSKEITYYDFDDLNSLLFFILIIGRVFYCR
jgi:hypothetical protein